MRKLYIQGAVIQGNGRCIHRVPPVLCTSIVDVWTPLEQKGSWVVYNVEIGQQMCPVYQGVLIKEFHCIIILLYVLLCHTQCLGMMCKLSVGKIR